MGRVGLDQPGVKKNWMDPGGSNKNKYNWVPPPPRNRKRGCYFRKIEREKIFNSRPAGGGGKGPAGGQMPPCGFSQIAPEGLEISF